MLSIEESDPSAQISDTSIKGTCLSLLIGGYDTTMNFELIPFGSGRRSCPGTTLALQVLHLTLAQLLHGFELGTVLDMPIDITEGPGITSPKATPLEVTFRPRLDPSLYV
ncbi:Protopine 6-monooxygenase [Heracleum sosnowskyi]|uniref:Protopine 6-monooxygenase n=1 Tax=Heracleum sosnowskyi TaxID=360622 RepID=A0AAD8IHW7_9APIA|nr:Protopine 6-monooxygenase [Heracleum sosnowskyi]